MAKRKAKAKRKKADKKTISVRIEPVGSESAPKYYSNYVQVSHTPYEFRLRFAQTEPPEPQALKRLARTGIMPAEVRCEVFLPEGVLLALVEARKTNHAKFAKIQPKTQQAEKSRKGRG